MTAPTPTLADFLLAQLAADEAAAERIRDCDYFHGVESDAEADVLTLADPARVLADVKAKRAIVKAVRDYSPELEHGDNGEWAFDLTLRALAQPYRGAEGWQEAWDEA